jgi:small-conductance mechanosensitive channel
LDFLNRSTQYLGWIVKQHPWLAYALEIVVLLILAWAVRRLILGYLVRWAARTQTSFDDKIVDLISSALRPLLILAVVAVTLNSVPIPAYILALCNRILTLGTIAVAFYYVYQAVLIGSTAWLARTTARQTLLEPARFFIRIVFAGLAVTILLDNLGVSLTAVWTTLGVGSVAIALALQDTLSNFFAGVYLRLDRPVRPGDFVKLDSGEEGVVASLGWRSTRIQTLPNNVVVVPNAKLASAIVTNYSMPDPAMSLLVPISVSYDSDPDQVERILIEEATVAANEVEGLLPVPVPFVRFIPGFGDSALNFTLICRVQTFVDQYLAQHELRKRILARFRREAISIPFPQRDIHLYEHSQNGSGVAGKESHAGSASRGSM